uniref:Uncharacterized protein n=1 Tax=Cannabis sativa TaxID=3483 RepID=A0A803R170_CANSA
MVRLKMGSLAGLEALSFVLVAVLRARNQFVFGNRDFDLASVWRKVFEDEVVFTRIRDKPGKVGTKSVFTRTAQVSFINVPWIVCFFVYLIDSKLFITKGGKEK